MIARILALALIATPLAAGTSGPVVTTDHGAVRGAAIPGGTAFKGIPFAAPPVGALRWRAAQPAAAWPGIRDATAFGAICPQSHTGTSEPQAPQSEDCLTVNVIVPDHPAGQKLPVLVSVFGGAFYVGSGRKPVDEGVTDLLAKGIVLVSMNYRVGRLGFFTHPALTREGAAHGESGTNFWLTDQIAALNWVQRNIANFGGDPAAVTIIGCSSGGSSINSLMVAPPARGLFARAAAHSGGGLFNASRPLALAEQQGLDYAATLGVTGTDAAALAKLRRFTPEQLLAGESGPPNFGAVVDGRLLPHDISVAFARGEIAHVPLMIGSTSNEASVFGLMGFDRSVLKARFDIDLDTVRPAYEAAGPLTNAELLRQVQTDFIFTSGAIGLAGLAARAGLPVYAYHFAYLDAAQRGTAPGVPHCGDMGYGFGRATSDARDAAMVATTQAQWANFVQRGEPNGAGLPNWPRFRPGDGQVLVVSDTPAATADFRTRQLAPWFAKWETRTRDTIPR